MQRLQESEQHASSATCSLKMRWVSWVLLASNRRYLEFISAIDDPTNGTKSLGRRVVLTGLKLRERFVIPPPQCTAVSDLIADT
ncbi:MAG TPA: hypothetical protein VIV60_07450 [Polyangiaceae bacterium]